MHRLIFPTLTFIANILMVYFTFQKRHSILTHVFTWLGAYVLVFGGYVVLYLFEYPEPILIYALSIFNFLAIYILFRESVPQKIFLFFSNWGFTSFLATLATWTSSSLPEGEFREGVTVGVYFLFFLFFIPAYYRWWAKGFRSILMYFDKGKPYFAVLPAMAFILFVSQFGVRSALQTWRDFALMFLFEALVVFMYFLLFSHFHIVYAHFKANETLNSIKRQKGLQKKYYEELDRTQKTLMKQSHDMRHHLLTLSSLAETGDTVGLQKYISTFLKSLPQPHIKNYCENRVANAVISAYLGRAETKNIHTRIAFDLPQKIPIEEYDLCTLFGNSLENALEACERIQGDRYIDVRSRVEGRHMVLRVENTSLEVLKKTGGYFFSSKGEVGGLGLESIRMLVEKYQGSMKCQHEGGVFTLSAVLCLELEEAN